MDLTPEQLDQLMPIAERWATATAEANVAALEAAFRVGREAAAMEKRCPNCDHLASIHSDGGCWYSVMTSPGQNLVCVCIIELAEAEQPRTLQEVVTKDSSSGTEEGSG